MSEKNQEHETVLAARESVTDHLEQLSSGNQRIIDAMKAFLDKIWEATLEQKPDGREITKMVIPADQAAKALDEYASALEREVVVSGESLARAVNALMHLILIRPNSTEKPWRHDFLFVKNALDHFHSSAIAIRDTGNLSTEMVLMIPGATPELRASIDRALQAQERLQT